MRHNFLYTRSVIFCVFLLSYIITESTNSIIYKKQKIFYIYVYICMYVRIHMVTAYKKPWFLQGYCTQWVFIAKQCSNHHGQVWSSNLWRGKYLCLFAGRSTVSDHFDAISIPQLSQHCTGWQSAACVHSVEYHNSWGHSGYLGAKPPIAPPQTHLCQPPCLLVCCHGKHWHGFWAEVHYMVFSCFLRAIKLHRIHQHW